MNQQKKLLNQEPVRRACREGLENEGSLTAALELLFREGMKDAALLPGAEQSFARRALEMYDEFQRQLAACHEAPEAWLRKQAAECGGEDARLLAGGAAVMAAEMYKGEDEPYMDRLPARLDAEREAGDPVRMLDQFGKTPLQELFLTWRSYPLLDERKRKAAACMLAVLSYVEIKNGADCDMAPDLSFDSVCMMSCAVTEAMCRPEKEVRDRHGERSAADYAQSIAAVCGVMCSQYLWVDVMAVCVGCMRSLIRGVGYFFRGLSTLLSGISPEEEGHVEVKAPTQVYDFDAHWEQLLRQPGNEKGDRKPMKKALSEEERQKREDRVTE